MAAILSLILQLAGISAREVSGRVASLSVMFVLALGFLLLGLMGLSAAAWLALARVMDPLLAALIMGSVAVIIAAILLLVARSHARAEYLLYGRLKPPATPPPAPDNLAVLLPLAAMAVLGFLLSGSNPKA
jgi:hypothetical protein